MIVGISKETALPDTMPGVRKNLGIGGFTLVELLVTLSIAAILMGIIAPKISALFPDPASSTVTRFHQVLMKARWLAARDQTPVRVIFDLQRQEINLYEVGQGKEKIISSTKLPAGIKMVGFWNMGTNSRKRLILRFLPDGKGEGFGVFLERGTNRMTAIGYPFRSGVELVPGWVERPQDA